MNGWNIAVETQQLVLYLSYADAATIKCRGCTANSTDPCDRIVTLQ